MTYDEHDHEAGTSALGQLADALTERGYQAQLITSDGQRPSLAIRNPAAPILAENVLADTESFWWPWADRIAPVTDVAAAADRVARVLAAVSEPAHE
jgi:hypothetical protein